MQEDMVDNGVLPGIVGFKWLRLCEAFCSAFGLWRARLIMIGYQTKLNWLLLTVPIPPSLSLSSL